MKTLSVLLLLSLLVGCKSAVEVDLAPPPAPQGLRTISLDNAVEIHWLPSPAGDIAGYNVWRRENGGYSFHLIGGTANPPFVDESAANGITYYYSVSAYDRNMNESPLSDEVVFDTPRPEGYGVQIANAIAFPADGGYDFSSYSVGRYDDASTDVYFEAVNGRNMLKVWTDTDIQDMGYTESLDEISSAPTAGWSPTKSAEAIAGHSYVLWTWDDHYAKLRIVSVSGNVVTFDWSYQTATANTELKRRPDPGGSRAPIRLSSPGL